jgi:MinD superfamily P-loop ATPase
MYDVNTDNTEKILGFCRENSVEVAGRIPFNHMVTEAMVNGKTIMEHSPESDVAEEIQNIWKHLCSSLKSGEAFHKSC